VLMFRACEVSVTPFSEWVSVPQLVSLFHVSSMPSPAATLRLLAAAGAGRSSSPTTSSATRSGGGGEPTTMTPPISPTTTHAATTSSSHSSNGKKSSAEGPLLVGGMLFADGEFLFGEMPFVRNRVKDVRCRLEFDSTDNQSGNVLTNNSTTSGLAWLATVPQPPKVPTKLTSSSFGGDEGNGISVDGPVPASSSGVSAAAIGIAVPGSKRGSTENPLNIMSGRDVVPTSPTTTAVFPMPTILPERGGGGAHRASMSGNTSTGAYPQTGKYIAGGVRLPANVNVASNGIATCRVHFRVEEFECGAMSWVVQRFQLVEPNSNVTYGPVFARAFQPADAFLSNNNASGHHGGNRVRKVHGGVPLPPVGGGGDASPPQAGTTLDSGVAFDGSVLSESTFAASQFGVGMDEMHRAKRKALPGEERLRVLKPALYQWCLDRSPTEMGAGATIIKELLLYFRHTFSVVRTIRTLMLSVRRIQTACRRMLERRRTATVRMLTEWTKLELEVQSQLNSYVPVSNDPVDAAVYEALKANIITDDEFKSSVITQMYNARQQERLSLPPEKRSDELLASRYRFFIPAQDLLAESHRRLVERLCRTGDSPIFQDPRIREILRDRTDEILRAKAKKERDEQRRKVAARSKGTFGTSSRGADGRGGASPSNTRRRSPPPQSPSRASGSSLMSGTGGGQLLSMIPSPPPALHHHALQSHSISVSLRNGGGGTPRKTNRHGGGGGAQRARGPRPQHLRVLDAMFDDV
jgi:hypothetical protein